MKALCVVALLFEVIFSQFVEWCVINVGGDFTRRNIMVQRLQQWTNSWFWCVCVANRTVDTVKKWFTFEDAKVDQRVGAPSLHQQHTGMSQVEPAIRWISKGREGRRGREREDEKIRGGSEENLNIWLSTTTVVWRWLFLATAHWKTALAQDCVHLIYSCINNFKCRVLPGSVVNLWYHNNW